MSDSSSAGQLMLGRVVNSVKAKTPKPVYRVVRSGWHQLTGTVDRLGFRRLAWQWRLPTEVGHWELWLSSRGMERPDDFENRLKSDLPLQDHLRKLLPAEPTDSAYRVLDVGAGPLTTVGKTVDGRQIDLVCIDPLASVYDTLLANAGIEPPVRTQYGEAEKLADIYPENSFDLVHAANALDHAHDPIAAIKAGIRVLKPGRYFYLEHTINEGERQAYGGLHQWNFGLTNDAFAITSKEGQQTVMAEALRGIADVRHELVDNVLSVHIQKLTT